MKPNYMRAIGRATGIALLARMLTLLFGLGVTALLSRLVPAADLATYWIALSSLSLVVLVSQTGVGQIAMSDISQAIARGETTEAQATASNAMGVVFLAGAGVALAVIFVLRSGMTGGAATLPTAVQVFVLVGGAICSLAMQVVDTLRSHLRLSAASWLASQPATGGFLPSSILLFGLVAISFSPPTEITTLAWVCMLYLLGWIVMLIFGVLLLHWPALLAPRWNSIQGHKMIKIMQCSLPVLSGSLAMFAITQADLWFVYHNTDALETASYGIAASFVKYVSAVNVMLGALLPGLVGSMWAKGDRERLLSLLVRMCRLGAITAALIVAVLAFVGAPLLETIVGPAYVSAWAPLMALSVGHLVNSVLGYPQVLLITAGHTRPILLASVIASFLTLLALALVTPRWGGVGAACASAVGVVVYNTIVSIACIRTTGIHCHALAFNITKRA